MPERGWCLQAFSCDWPQKLWSEKAQSCMSQTACGSAVRIDMETALALAAR